MEESGWYNAVARTWRSAPEDFDAAWFVPPLQDSWPAVWAAIALYLAMLTFGPGLVRLRSASASTSNPTWQSWVRAVSCAWNFGLAIFSLLGALPTAAYLVSWIAQQGWHATLCPPARTTYGNGVVGLATTAFILSKVFELIDTVLLIAAGKEVLFLHWYHHVTVLLYCWHAFAHEAPYALYFVAMNYTVHAVMYTYFGLMTIPVASLRNRVRRIVSRVAVIVTAMQLLQMAVGVAVVSYTFVHIASHEVEMDRCRWPPEHRGGLYLNLQLALAMYASYLALFAKLFYDMYVSEAGRKRRKERLLAKKDTAKAQ